MKYLRVFLGGLSGLLIVSCGSPPELSRPNILWLMSDELRADGVGAYGTPWAQTPNLDRLDCRRSSLPPCSDSGSGLCSGPGIHPDGQVSQPDRDLVEHAQL